LQKQGKTYREEQSVICGKDDADGRERMTTDEELLLRAIEHVEQT